MIWCVCNLTICQKYRKDCLYTIEPNTMASTNHEIEASSVAVRELKARAEWWIIDWLSVERRRQRRRPQFLPIGGVTKGRTRNGRHGLHLFFLPSLCALKNTREPAVEQREKENEKKKIRIVYRNEVVPLQQLWKRGKRHCLRDESIL